MRRPAVAALSGRCRAVSPHISVLRSPEEARWTFGSSVRLRIRRGSAAPARRTAAARASRLSAATRERGCRRRASPRRALVRDSRRRSRGPADAGLAAAKSPRRPDRHRGVWIFDARGAGRARPGALPVAPGRCRSDRRPAERSRQLRVADGLWRGAPLAGLNVSFASSEAAGLEELRLAALEDRIEADLELGHDGKCVSELSGLVARYPLRERLRGQLILALYRSGRQADALEAYRQTRAYLTKSSGSSRAPRCASSSAPSCATTRRSLAFRLLRQSRRRAGIPAPVRRRRSSWPHWSCSAQLRRPRSR
jgi:hypothetical protein